MTHKMEKFPLILKRLMDKNGLTQSRLAKMCGVDRSQISRYTMDGPGGIEPRLSILVAISKALRVPLSQLTGDGDIKRIEKAISTDELTEEQRLFLESYENLPENDPRRKAIDALLGQDVQ